MHSASFELEGGNRLDGGDVLVAITALVTEGRIPRKLCKFRGFYEGPHCYLSKSSQTHQCDMNDALCLKYNNVRSQVLSYWEKDIPLCIEVLLHPNCACIKNFGGDCADSQSSSSSSSSSAASILVEQWHLSVGYRRSHDSASFNVNQLISAIRSQLHFSQISAWLSKNNETFSNNIISYRLTVPGETYETSRFTRTAQSHQFPVAEIGNGYILNISLLSLPRTEEIPRIKCFKCEPTEHASAATENVRQLFDDRMHTSCTLKGKHRCMEEVDEYDCPSTSKGGRHKPKLYLNIAKANMHQQKLDLELSSQEFAEVLCVLRQSASSSSSSQTTTKSDLNKGDILLDAIVRGASIHDDNCVHTNNNNNNNKKQQLPGGMFEWCDSKNASDKSICDNMNDTSDNKHRNIYVDVNCDNNKQPWRMQHVFNNRYRVKARQKIDFTEHGDTASDSLLLSVDTNACNVGNIPSALEQAKFRKNLDSAASMVFHSRTGLPLTSSPAPVRRGKKSFDFDSSINSVSAIRSALFSLATDEDSESDCSIVSPCSPDNSASIACELSLVKYRRGQAANLLGSFEESVLNGRLEPDSTVHGFTAELGASGSFVPCHLVVPVTVFFYTLGDMDKVSSPYLGHINLGKKGYNLPKSGTVQVTLFNPLRTVVKMFVVMYDLNDMPANSQTFIRQRTLYMPTNCHDPNIEWGQKWLRYLIHLRFKSSKSGRIYLHSDIRMIIFRKSDMDTATAHGVDMSYELRSFTHTPCNPKYSPRK